MKEILEEVSALIGPVYLVGGSVRDHLVGKDLGLRLRHPADAGRIEQRIRAAGRRPYLIGKRFGTVGFKLDGQLIEVTTFRQEAYTLGSRKPSVEFVDDITADLSRRDFTINAIAMRPDGSLIDPWGGRLDIMARTIKAVGAPADRYRKIRCACSGPHASLPSSVSLWSRTPRAPSASTTTAS